MALFSKKAQAEEQVNAKPKKKRLDVKKWSGVAYLQPMHDIFKQTLRGLFVPAKAKNPETFDEAVQRLGLSETDLINREKRFRRNAYLFVALALLAFAYAMNLLFHGYFSSTLLGMAVMGLFLVQAFRFHFWAFQTKNRKLGCTFKQWWHSDITLEEPKQ